jgi:RNA polymerase sigma-70 factor (ECF subfamily)
MFRARVWCSLLTIDVVKRAQGGDHEAFEALARGAYHRLLAIAYRILRDQSAADDAVQRALIHAWRELPTLRDPGRFDAWLYRLIVNACRDEQRQAQRWRVHATVTDINMPKAGSELDAFVERNYLDGIFRKLSVEHRAVLVLHHYVGLSAPEVAAALGIPTGTVYSRLHYGTRELRDLLEKQRDRAADLGGTW